MSRRGRFAGAPAAYQPPDPGEGTTREVYCGLRKDEASALLQIRIERIGLRLYLFSANVPDFPTPRCNCGLDKVSHVTQLYRQRMRRRRVYYTHGGLHPR